MNAMALLVVLFEAGQVADTVERWRDPAWPHTTLPLRLFADTAFPEHGIVCCCCQGESAVEKDARELETVFSLVDAEVRDLRNPPRWIIFTRGDSYWNPANTLAELARLEDYLAPASPSTDVLLVGGGGYIVFDNFMIVSVPGLHILADQGKMAAAKANLLKCFPPPKTTPNHYAGEIRIMPH